MCISILTCFMAAGSEIEPLSLTVKTAALTGVGGILGLINVSQSVVIVILLRRLKKRYKSK